jgi:hypothetical protein
VTDLKVGQYVHHVTTARLALIYAAALVRKQAQCWPPHGTERKLLDSVESDILDGLREVENDSEKSDEELLKEAETQQGSLIQMPVKIPTSEPAGEVA